MKQAAEDPQTQKIDPNTLNNPVLRGIVEDLEKQSQEDKKTWRAWYNWGNWMNWGNWGNWGNWYNGW